MVPVYILAKLGSEAFSSLADRSELTCFLVQSCRLFSLELK